MRPICIVPSLDAQSAFKRYEYMLYIMAQITRLVHEDSGFAWYAMKRFLGRSNYIMNDILRTYDTEYAPLRKMSANQGNGTGRPMKSFATRVSPMHTKNAWGTYISTADDLTAAVFDAGTAPFVKNPNSSLTDRDIILGFKSTSTLVNLLIDLHSQFYAADLQQAVAHTGIRTTSNCVVPESFVKLLMSGWPALMKALVAHTRGRKGLRLFICGHSLGGALATLAGLIIAEGKTTNSLPPANPFDTIHVVSFGSPTVCGKGTKAAFNAHLESGLMTYDRVVTQTQPSLVTNLQSILVKNDYIPGFPHGYSHPGHEPSSETGGNPFTIQGFRRLYGVQSDTNCRDPQTWPFPEDPIQGTQPTPHIQPLMGGAHATGYLSNFIAVAPARKTLFVHGDTLGMVNQSAHRWYGVKNPVRPNSDKTAYFSFCKTGVKIQYLLPDGSLMAAKNPGTRKKMKGTRKV